MSAGVAILPAGKRAGRIAKKPGLGFSYELIEHRRVGPSGRDDVHTRRSQFERQVAGEIAERAGDRGGDCASGNRRPVLVDARSEGHEAPLFRLRMACLASRAAPISLS